MITAPKNRQFFSLLTHYFCSFHTSIYRDQDLYTWFVCVCSRCKHCSRSTFVEPEVSGIEMWDEHNIAKGKKKKIHLNNRN